VDVFAAEQELVADGAPAHDSSAGSPPFAGGGAVAGESARALRTAGTPRAAAVRKFRAGDGHGPRLHTLAPPISTSLWHTRSLFPGVSPVRCHGPDGEAKVAIIRRCAQPPCPWPWWSDRTLFSLTIVARPAARLRLRAARPTGGGRGIRGCRVRRHGDPHVEQRHRRHLWPAWWNTVPGEPPLERGRSGDRVDHGRPAAAPPADWSFETGRALHHLCVGAGGAADRLPLLRTGPSSLRAGDAAELGPLHASRRGRHGRHADR